MKKIHLKKLTIFLILPIIINPMRINQEKKNTFPKIPKNSGKIKSIKITRLARSKFTKEKKNSQITQFVKVNQEKMDLVKNLVKEKFEKIKKLKKIMNLGDILPRHVELLL